MTFLYRILYQPSVTLYQSSSLTVLELIYKDLGLIQDVLQDKIRFELNFIDICISGQCPILTNAGYLHWSPCIVAACPKTSYRTDEVYKCKTCIGISILHTWIYINIEHKNLSKKFYINAMRVFVIYKDVKSKSILCLVDRICFGETDNPDSEKSENREGLSPTKTAEKQVKEIDEFSSLF